MNSRRHVGFWICLVLFMFLATPVVRDGQALEAFVSGELALTRQAFGDRTGRWLGERAALVFRLYTPAGAVARARIEGEGMARTQRIVPGPGTSMTLSYNSYVQGLVLNLYVACLRALIVMLWLLLLVPVFGAAVLDGLVQRAIKRAEFGAIRPAAFSIASLVVIPRAMAPLFYLVVPFPVSPLVAPLWALALALPLSWLVSNSQPVFGRA
jgi:hypothetical protein